MSSPDISHHEPMMTTSPVQGQGHGQSQFLPGYLLGDSTPHSLSSPRLWSTGGISPGHRPGHSASSRPLSRSESLRQRGGGPPVRGLLSSSSADPSLLSPPLQARTPSSAAARVASPGPPTTGMYGTPQGRSDRSFNPSSAIPSSPTQLDPFYTQGESLRSDDVLDETWVTVFGFPPGATSFILQQFSHYGNIIRHVASAEGNWMHVHYQSKLQAKKALSKNGKVFASRIMIGVTPCIDKTVMGDKENAGVMMTPHKVVGEMEGGSPLTPIRPLTAAYTTARSEYEVMKNKPVPRKDNSIVSKVKEYMFGW